MISCMGKFDGNNCFMAPSFQKVVRMAVSRDVYGSGGEKVLEESLLYVDKMYIMEINR